MLQCIQHVGIIFLLDEPLKKKKTDLHSILSKLQFLPDMVFSVQFSSTLYILRVTKGGIVMIPMTFYDPESTTK